MTDAPTKQLPRPSKPQRKLRSRRPFYWSQGPGPSTERGRRRHARRSAERARHAKSLWFTL